MTKTPDQRLLLADLILKEAVRAKRLYSGDFHSAHEGFAVLKEEVDELWDEVRCRVIDRDALRKECIQVGAMASRFLVDLDLVEEPK